MTPTQSLTRQVIALSLPSSLSQLLRLATVFVATLMVARLGTLPLAANGLGYTLYLNLFLMFIGIAYAVSILVGREWGFLDDEPG